MSNTANPFGNPVADDNGGKKFDWGSIKGTPSKFLIPEGVYKVKVVNVEYGTSKNGNEMLTWDFAVIEGEHAGFELRSWTVLTPGKNRSAYKYRDVLGITPTDSGVEVAINREARAQVINEKYDGETKSKIKTLLPL